MKILMFSADKNIFIEGSEAQCRMIEYSSLVEELHIVVKSQISNLKSQKFGNVFVYPTNDRIRWLYFINAYKISSSIIRNWKLEIRNCVITCQDPFETGFVGYLIKRKFKLPLQIQIHTDFLNPYFAKESIKNKLRVVLGNWLVKEAVGIRVVSERIKKSLVVSHELLNDGIVVLPIFVDAEKIKNTSIKTDLRRKYPGCFIVLMASRLTREKNIELAIKAVKEVAKKHPKILLLIVGSGPERENLESQISSLKLQNNTVIEDWCGDLVSYYKTADLFLLTSDYEGYGRTVVEATVAGLPVLMTDVGVAAGSVAPVGNKKILIEYLNLLIENSSEREKSLKDQQKILNFYGSKKDYLNRIKQSWSQCL